MVQLNHKGGQTDVQVKNQSQERSLRKFDENEKGQRRSPFKSDFATTKKHGGVTLNIDADSEEVMRCGFRDSKSAKSKKEVALRKIAHDFKIAYVKR